MISVEFVGGRRRWDVVRLQRPTVVALYSFRYDAALVPALIQNLTPAVDAFVAYDDRRSTEPFSSEPQRRSELLARAREIGADWVLAVDPDERFEQKLATTIGTLTKSMRPVAWSFWLRELYSPDAYRIDGVWGHKQVARLFPTPSTVASGPALHGYWFDRDSGLEIQLCDLNIFHLKMITAKRRQMRSRLYAHLDPHRAYQSTGYDYLDDEDGLVLQCIPPGRGFYPSHVEDDDTWMPSEIKDTPPDPPRSVAALMQANAALGAWNQAARLARKIMEHRPTEPVSLVSTARVLTALGRSADATIAMEMAARHLTQIPKLHAKHDDRWRRWFSGASRYMRGRAVPESDLAVVVIGFKAREDLKAAVQSVLEQGPVEVVVVNSGGGSPDVVLAPVLDQLTLIDIEAPLRAGAARNIGIDASHSRYVSFLAGDCIACPGWVAGRIKSHRGGARAVASAMIAFDAGDDICMASYLLLFAGRSPRFPTSSAQRYGLSFDRLMFAEAGYFNPALRIGEDSAFAERLGKSLTIVWNRDVQTKHAAPTGLRDLIIEMWQRGIRAARYQIDLRQKHRGGPRLRALVHLLRLRMEIGERIGRHVLRLAEGRMRRLRRLLGLGAIAYAVGVYQGIRRLNNAQANLRASGAVAANNIETAIGKARQAVAEDAESVSARLQLADLLRSRGDTADLGEHLRTAMWLTVFDEERQLRLVDWLAARNLLDEAWELGALADFCTPHNSKVHVQLAELARQVGNEAAFRQAIFRIAAVEPTHQLAEELGAPATVEVASAGGVW